MAGGFGNIGTAHITVELDFDRAVQEARAAGIEIGAAIGSGMERSVASSVAVVSAEIVAGLNGSSPAAARAGAKVGTAFGSSMVDSVASTVATAIKEAVAALSGAAAPAGRAGAQVGAAFGASLARSVASGTVIAAKEVRLLGTSSQPLALRAGTQVGASFGSSMARSIGVSVAATRARIASGFASTVPVARVQGARAGRAFGRAMSATVTPILALLTSKTAALGGALIGAFAAVKSVKTTQELGKTQKLLAQNFGFTTKAAGEYAAIAKVLDIDQKQLALGLTTLSRNSVAAAKGSKKQAAAFKALGISQKILKSGDTSAILEATAEALKNMEGGAKKAALGQALFGRGFLSLRPLIKGGRDDIRALRDESEKFGAVIKDPEAVSKFTESMHSLEFAVTGAEVQIGSRLIPSLATGITKFTEFVATSKPLHRILAGFGAAISGIAKGLGGFGTEFAKAFSKQRGQDAKSFSDTMRDLGKWIGQVAEVWLPRLGGALGTLAGHKNAVKAIVGVFIVWKVQALIARDATLALRGSVLLLRGAVIALELANPVGILIGIGAASVLAFKKFETFRKGLIELLKVFEISELSLAKLQGASPGQRKKITDSFDLLIGKIKAVDSGAKGAGTSTKGMKLEFDHLRNSVTTTVQAFDGIHAQREKTKTTFNLIGKAEKVLGGALTRARELAGRLASGVARTLRVIGRNIRTALDAKVINTARVSIVNLSHIIRRFAENLGQARTQLFLTNPFFRFLRLGVIGVAGAFRTMILRMTAAVTFLRTVLVAQFRATIARIHTVVAGASLFGAGFHLMGTFLSGLRAGFKPVQAFVRFVAVWIRANKGPISADRNLLKPAGVAIMEGFESGLRGKFAGIQKWVREIGGFFKGSVSSATIEPTIANILLGKGGTGDLTKKLEGALGLPKGFHIGAGLTGFLHPTSGWADTLNQVRLIEKLFNVGMTSGFRSYDTVPGPGVSQHTLGQAADFGTSRASGASLTRLATFMSKIVPQVMKQVIWLNSLWQGGTPGHGFVGGHMDHVHLGWQPRAAGGGVRKGQGYRWNERGAETLIPHGNGYVMNAGRTKELVSALKAIAQQGGRGSGQTDNRVQTVNLITNGDGRGARPMLEAVFARA